VESGQGYRDPSKAAATVARPEERADLGDRMQGTMGAVHENEVGGSSIIWVLPLVIADSERDMPGIEPWATRLVHQLSDHWATRSEGTMGAEAGAGQGGKSTWALLYIV
jgi:hypothetical protein